MSQTNLLKSVARFRKEAIDNADSEFNSHITNFRKREGFSLFPLFGLLLIILIITMQLTNGIQIHTTTHKKEFITNEITNVVEGTEECTQITTTEGYTIRCKKAT